MLMNLLSRLSIAFFVCCVALLFRPQSAPMPSTGAIEANPAPTFYRDVLPILQHHCQSCHRVGEIAPFPLVTFEEAHVKSEKIAAMVRDKKMPPWFADPCCGHFSNDPSLTEEEIATLIRWAEIGAQAGESRSAPEPREWTKGWNIPQPDVVLQMPMRVKLPARGVIEYTYEIVPTGFTEGKWVQMSEIRPSSRMNVHHAVVYVRPPDSQWLRHAPVGVPFTASDLKSEQDRRDAHWTDADVLLVYAPGSSPDNWPPDMAKYIPAGSDIIFQMHYTAHGHATHDQSSIGVVFAKEPPKRRVLTLQLTDDKFIIPPGVDNYRVEAHGTLPNDATLLSFLPHMHLRGKQFEYNILRADRTSETLLRVHWNFYWQMSYRLAQPMPLKAGTTLQAVAWYDNSRKNPHNPDPDAAVRWGDQTTDEMMVGFFDVAVPASTDKPHYFIRDNNAAADPRSGLQR
jgi:Copper type II ascorbate-dependent monooxygenase, C-terminal domain